MARAATHAAYHVAQRHEDIVAHSSVQGPADHDRRDRDDREGRHEHRPRYRRRLGLGRLTPPPARTRAAARRWLIAAAAIGSARPNASIARATDAAVAHRCRISGTLLTGARGGAWTGRTSPVDDFVIIDCGDDTA